MIRHTTQSILKIEILQIWFHKQIQNKETRSKKDEKTHLQIMRIGSENEPKTNMRRTRNELEMILEPNLQWVKIDSKMVLKTNLHRIINKQSHNERKLIHNKYESILKMDLHRIEIILQQTRIFLKPNL